ncbi:uncharacterized protein LOC134653456 [Cydia amplana]|uniref:uncharacterized protein LOC134653456 n=1 Tax=Cydia amplana TaxID=1869771 RepID=UPI002FE6BFFA
MACIEFTVNGRKCSVDESTPRDTSLNAYLRYILALPGTKAMCHEGGCGACIVSVRACRASGATETFSVNSCLVLVFSCHGWDITTIEGVGNRLTGYSDVQKRIAAFNGSQCGYCTPGWVMHMTSLQDKHLTMTELERSFGSNTCRCTGFRPILDAMKSFAVDASADLCQKVSDIEDIKICSKTNSICERRCSGLSEDSDWSVISDQQLDKLEKKKDDKMISFTFGKKKFFKIYDVDDVFDLLDKYGVDSYMFVDGNTGKGTVETFEYPRILIDISGVKSLKKYEFDQNLILGANMALEDCITLFKETAKSQSEFSYLAEFVKHFELVAHIPVRKIGSLAGNLMLKHANPSYQSDVFLLLETVGAVVVIKQSNGKKKTLSLLDFLKYDMRGMLMVAIELPPLSSKYVFRSYKIMPRNQNALAIVNAAFLFKLNPKTKIIEDADICYGNIGPTFVHAKGTEAFLKGKMVFNNVTLQAAIKILNKEIVLKYDPAQPSSDFRKKLAVGLFYKVILNICPPNALNPRYRSGAALVQRPLSHGSQEFQTDSSLYPLNQPVPKLEAAIQAAGEAKYANDIPPMPREVFGAFVQSTVHSGELVGVDSGDVLDIEGVIAVYTAKDIPGVNSFSVPGFQLQTEEEEIIVSKNILFYGQPVAIVIATSEALAVKVAKKVKVTYKNVPSSAPVLTIDQAKKDSKRYVASDTAIKPKGKGSDVKTVIKGVYEIEGQYHYYMEPVTCVVVPVDQGLEVYDSTQWMDLTQRAISRCLNMNESDIHLKVRRIGGGFGGKISRNVRTSTACALAAKLLNTPCRFVVPLQTNLATAGGRLPCQCEYEVGVDDNGKIQYLNATIVEDNGCSNNENILAYVSSGFTNCYVPDYFDVKMATVTTDTPSNTFARAPGTSEGMACVEHIMEHIAFAVQKDPTDVRIANMRTDDNDLPTLIDTWKKETDYDKRLQSIQEFNKANRWMKKAIKVNIMSFPVEYYGNYSAMVSIYRGDGTVTVTTGGVEMGQGVNTKVAQIVAYKLGIPLEMVTVLPNYSFTAANNVFSGSSIVSECVCYSAIKSCDTLNARLLPLRQKMSNPSWGALIKQAGDDQIDLTATYMMTDKENDLDSYSAFAVAILEVQLDVLTARYEILRCDILEDVGLSVNPTIDISQVEGAYVQGLGYFTTEKLVRDPQTGRLLSNRSLTYHVPLALDIPADFRVKLRFNSKNTTGVLGSKAVGEMGICTAHGITHVLRQCIHESRAESRYDTMNWINIDVPFDTESIMTALDVQLEEFLIT